MPVRATGLLLALATGSAAQQPDARSDSTIRRILKERVDARLAPGIVLGVIDPDGRRRVLAYGSSGTGRPLDGSSLFEIGSVTKTFTASLLAEMVSRGEVGLRDPVAKYLPAEVKVPSRNGREITLLDLATQTSGLPRDPDNIRKTVRNDYDGYTPEMLYAFLASHNLRRDPGSVYEYSNVGFMLLGHALTRRAGAASYEALLRPRILDPLGLKDTRIDLPAGMVERFVRGHDAAGEFAEPWTMAPTLGGVGMLHSTANDMLAYLAANINADVDSTRGPLARVLRDAHVKRFDVGPSRTIGLAWSRFIRPTGDTVLIHNGGTAGFKSFIAFDSRRHIAVAVLSNGELPVDDIGALLIAPELPFRAPVLPAWATLKPVALPPATLDSYVGTYIVSPTISYAISRQGDQLFFQSSALYVRPLLAEDADHFLVRASDIRIVFQRDASARITGLVSRSGNTERVATRVP